MMTLQGVERMNKTEKANIMIYETYKEMEKTYEYIAENKDITDFDCTFLEDILGMAKNILNGDMDY